MVSCGVLSGGVEGPNAAIELGVNTEQFSCLPTSRILYKPFMFTSHALSGYFSPTADNTAARLIIVSTLCFLTISCSFFPSVISTTSKGPDSITFSSPAFALLLLAITLSTPYTSLKPMVSSEPIWPKAPATNIFLICCLLFLL